MMNRERAVEIFKFLKGPHKLGIVTEVGKAAKLKGRTAAEAEAEAEQEAERYWHHFAEVEGALRKIYPLMPFLRESRKKTQRACFGWDGIRISSAKGLELPLPTVAELEVALDGLLDDAIEIVPQVLP